ncbi:MAG: hypothetical protein V8S01_08125 [Dorea sp.]
MDIVALLEVLVKEIIAAEEKFLKNPKDFYSLETSVKASTENFSAGFLSAVLSSMNERHGMMPGENSSTIYAVMKNEP